LTLYRNGVSESIASIVKNLNAAKLDSTTEVVISPPAIYLALTRELANPNIGVAAQNVYDKPNGAFTGEISVEQLRDAKINWAVIGHSERRVILKESDEVCIFAVPPNLNYPHLSQRENTPTNLY
jgi:triosephosphate isomerase